MNVASIDIGSNTVLMLIAEVDEKNNSFRTLKNYYRSPRLGKGIGEDGNISEASLSKFYSVLEEYSQLIKEFNCEKVLAKATNAMRIAGNAEEIIDYVKQKYGISIEVIPGDVEANISYLGASSALKNESRKIVIDIGGGSTEVIYGAEDEIKYKKSFSIGAVNLTEKFVKGKIVSEKEILEIKNYCIGLFGELSDIIPGPIAGIAVAGTPTTLSSINQGLREYVEEKVEGSLLTFENLGELVRLLKPYTPEERLNKFGSIVSGREDVILCGAIILEQLCRILKLEKIIVSGKGIRYGIIEDYLGNRDKRQIH